jgi:membrane protease YdiL (CAAX protease family)
MNYNLLPGKKTFRESLIPYLLPYALYVMIEALPGEFLSPEMKRMIKLITVSVTMAVFFKQYRFGKLTWKHSVISLIASPIALALWIFPLMYIKNSTGTNISYSNTNFILRTINSTLLVAVFEELFLRVYLMQWFYQAGIQLKKKGWLNSIMDVFEQTPIGLPNIPISRFSAFWVTMLFMLGHPPQEWLSSFLYFSFTNYIYNKTGSIWVCILIHGITNLSIALLVKFGGIPYLW